MTKVDTKSDNDVRDILEPLKAIAEKHGVAVICLMHNNKGQNAKALYKVMGSIGFVGTARSVWGIYQDGNDPKRHLFTFIKSNVSSNRSGLAYRIEDEGEVGKIVYEDGYVDETADDLSNPNNATTKIDYAKEWLREQLAEGAIDSNELKARAEKCGIATKTLFRAKDEWGKGSVKATKVGLNGWQWSWIGDIPKADDGRAF